MKVPRLVIGRFVSEQTLRGAVLWALLLGVYLTAKTLGIIKAYPTEASRHQLLATLGSNKGLEVLVGPPDLETIGGYITWNCLMVMLIVGSIWAIMLVTKFLRGEEENGRWEMFLSSPATPRRATSNVLAGILTSLLGFFVVLGVITELVGGYQGVDVMPQSALFFALVVTSGVALFTLVGAFTSQIMPSRGRAAGLAAGIFAASFLLRAVGDVTNAHWLLDVSPIGWLEKTQPLIASRPIWLLPVLVLGLILLVATLYLAEHRDMSASLFTEKDSHPARTGLLNSVFGLTLRVNRGNLFGWLVGMGFMAFFYGALTKTALQALHSIKTNGHAAQRLLHDSNLASGKAFLGAIFIILLLILLAYAANIANSIRHDEARGYLDNILVRPVTHWQWLGSRILFGSLAITLGGLLIGATMWLGVAPLHLGVSLSSLIQAGLNIASAGIFSFGCGVLAFGFAPRLTAFVAYGVLLWSFLIDMIGSGLHLNHWLLDTSLFNQLNLAPAVNPNWRVVGTLTALGLLLAAIGVYRFNQRDLVNE